VQNPLFFADIAAYFCSNNEIDVKLVLGLTLLIVLLLPRQLKADITCKIKDV